MENMSYQIDIKLRLNLSTNYEIKIINIQLQEYF